MQTICKPTGRDRTAPRMSVPDLSRYASAPSVHQGLVSRQRGGSTSVSLCDLVSLGADESAPPGGTENPRVGGSSPSLAVSPRRPFPTPFSVLFVSRIQPYSAVPFLPPSARRNVKPTAPQTSRDPSPDTSRRSQPQDSGAGTPSRHRVGRYPRSALQTQHPMIRVRYSKR